MSLFLTACIVVCIIIVYFEWQLPNVQNLSTAKLQVPLRIYSADKKLIAEYGAKRRTPITIDKIPQPLIDAVLATEDQRFYEHPGIDLMGLMRAAVELVETGKKSQGGSTITMQVARNFFLSSKKTYSRKFKEILLAIKIDNEFTKDQILELYLNKIYLGNRAYGVAAAAQVYYGKSLNELSLAQLAMLAGLPKAPSSLNPIANPQAALKRRNHVLNRMREKGFISEEDYQQAIQEPISAKYHGEAIALHAPYIAEMVRDAMLEHYGEQAYTNGFNVYTTINSEDQRAAIHALQQGLLAYDRRHGYRGATDNWGSHADADTLQQWQAKLLNQVTVKPLIAAVVVNVNEKNVTVVTAKQGKILLPWQNLAWAREAHWDESQQKTLWGKKPKGPGDILKVGDLIYIHYPPSLKKPYPSWQLAQIPKVQGAFVAMRPHDGGIKALVGGFNYQLSQFNRAIQAERQPGSNFKPFIYTAALEKGYTLSDLINDAPIVVDDPSETNLWRPKNDSRRFFGPTRLRVGLMRSRNLVSIRLLQNIGIERAAHMAMKFGFDSDKLPRSLSLALGSGLATPLQVATAYCVFANGGFKVSPYLIDHITDGMQKVIYRATPKVACEDCAAPDDGESIYPTTPMNTAPRIISPQIAYLMTSAMQSVIQHGTARKALALKRQDLAGKTGTTNEQMDAWFSGFNKHWVATAWVGFDQPRTLKEYGQQAALPIWMDFMKQVLSQQPEAMIAEPAGIVRVKIDPKTGLLANARQTNGIFELFRKSYVPTEVAPMTANDNHSVDFIKSTQPTPDEYDEQQPVF